MRSRPGARDRSSSAGIERDMMRRVQKGRWCPMAVVVATVVVAIGRMELRHSSLMEQHQTEGRQVEGMSSMRRWKRRAKDGSINGIRIEVAVIDLIRVRSELSFDFLEINSVPVL